MDQLQVVTDTIQHLLNQLVLEGVLDDQFLQLMLLQVCTSPLSTCPNLCQAPPPLPDTQHKHSCICLCVTMRQDDANPDFVSEVVELYFEDSAGKLDKLDGKLQHATVDFNEIDQLVHQFKGSSASFGARAMAHICVQLREAGHAQDAQSCRLLLLQLRDAFVLLRGRLQQFLELEHQRKVLAGPSGGGAPP
jgi:histidine-containing phosphotransfer protein